LIKRNEKFSGLKVFLPKVLHKDGKYWRDIHYERDILANIAWDSLTYDVKEYLDNRDAPLTTTTTIDVTKKLKLLDTEQAELNLEVKTKGEEIWVDKRLNIAFLTRPLLDVIPNPWQAARILLETIDALKDKKISEEGIYNGRLNLIENMKRHLKEAVHKMSEKIFIDKLNAGEIVFRLITNGNKKLNFEIVDKLNTMARQNEPKLMKSDNTMIDNNLFEIVYEKELNTLEKNFALYLSESEAVYWWHRMVARQDYFLQGWQRNKVYPDFIACVSGNKLLVLETKGLHLKGNDDTKYKQRFFELLTDYNGTSIDAGILNLKFDTNTSISFHMLIEDTWREDALKILS
ncbi:MAG: restriction endonuclease subunit R, partial [Candidatus Dadabacteria bacterium]|nr:restriction endonuclease subunit R [Candidatus Dadabacteria bacterium]